MSATTDKGDADASIFDPELLRRFGITRVGDVTGLDIVGIPVGLRFAPIRAVYRCHRARD